MTNDLILVRHIQASPETVYRCWTEADLLKKWFAPAPLTTPDAACEPEPGGRFYTRMRMPDGRDMASEGCVLLADPGRRFVFTDALRQGFRPNPTAFFTVDIRFTPKDGGTEYRVTALHADEDTRNKHADMGFETGWGTCADQLAAIAAGL